MRVAALETITVTQLTDRLIATIELMGIANIRNYDKFSGNKSTSQDEQGSAALDDAKHVVKEMEACIRTNRNKSAVGWYTVTRKLAESNLNEPSETQSNKISHQPSQKTQ